MQKNSIIGIGKRARLAKKVLKEYIEFMLIKYPKGQEISEATAIKWAKSFKKGERKNAQKDIM